MTEKYAGHYYTPIDTTLPSDDTTAIQELSGRQGDNMRTAYLQLMQTSGGVQSSWNLSGYTIKLSGKDSAGVVKTTTTASVVNATKGLVNLSIPSAFYQAAGDYQRAFLQILKDSQVVSTVNVGISVYENGLAITTSQSELYLDSVAQAEQSALALYEPLTTQTKALQTAQDAMTTELKAMQNTIGSTGVAKVGSNQTFGGTQTFNNATVTGTLTANALAGNALTAIQAMVGGLVSDSGVTAKGLTMINAQNKSLRMRQVKIGTVNMLFLTGSLTCNNALPKWGGFQDFVKIGPLEGQSNVMMLNPLQVADANSTLWLNLNGATLQVQEVGDQSNPANWYWNLMQIFIW